MSFASRVTYTGDNVTTQYNVPMPYISKAHINIYVNQTLQLDPMNYSWTGPSTINFGTAPAQDAAIEIVRNTSPSDSLVDFVDGSVLRAADLDTAYLHNFYLSQEYSDSYNNAINNILIQLATDTGIVETETNLIIDALVQEMLADAAAATLQTRVNDIDANAEAIITLGEGLQTQINTLAQGVAANVYVQAEPPVPGVGGVPNPILEGSRWYDSDDNNEPYIYLDSAWVSIEDPRIGNADADIDILQVEMGSVASAIVEEQFVRATETDSISQRLSLVGSETADGQAFILDLDTTKVGPTESIADRFSVLSAADSTNAANIISEQTARISADSAIASDVTSLTATVGTNTSNITTTQAAVAAVEGDVTTLYSKYGVSLSTNGYVQGFIINNGGPGAENAFVILADKFAVVDPSGDPGETTYTPFSISGGKITMTGDVTINGSLILNGTVVGNALVAGTIGATQIGTNAITTDKINASAITAAKISANAITATHIGVSTVAALGITTGSLTVDGALTMNTAGYIRNNTTTYGSGTGFFLGYDSSGTAGYKFRIGNTTDNYLQWDGSNLKVIGDVLVGEYLADNNIFLSATTERSHTGSSWSSKKSFQIDRGGTIRCTCDAYAGGSYEKGDLRIKKNGAVQQTWLDIALSYTTYSKDLTVSAGDTISWEVYGSRIWTDASEPAPTYIKNAYIKGSIVLPTGGTVLFD